MDDRLRHVLDQQGGAATRSTLRDSGLDRRVLRLALDDGTLQPVARGLLADAVRWQTWSPSRRHVALVRAALSRSCHDAAAAGESAATVLDLPLPHPPPQVPVVVRPRSAPRPEHGGRTRSTLARRAWLDADEVVEVEGIAVTTPARTFVDLARCLSDPHALAVADVLSARGMSPRDLLAAAERRPGLPGTRRARRVAGWADPRPESPLESAARGVMLSLGLPRPEPQVWVGPHGSAYRVDLLVSEHMTVVEADGKIKYTGELARPDQAWKDKLRRDRLLEWGYEVHRFVAADLRQPRAWGRRLVAAFRRAAVRHGLPEPTLTLPWL